MAADKFNVLCDIDGVLHRASRSITGAARFVDQLQKSGRCYLFLTNSPDFTPEQHSAKLRRFGMAISPSHFYTSAQAIVSFVTRKAKKPRVYVVGSKALKGELKTAGAVLSEKKADFVIVATGGDYGRSQIDKAIELICKGAKFITANREPASVTETGIESGCGALIAPIELATGCKAYGIGKPNHLMIRGAEEKYGIDPQKTLMIGDGLDTDIDVGMQTQMKTVLVLSGITSRQDLAHSAYQPDYVFPSVSHIRLSKLP